MSPISVERYVGVRKTKQEDEYKVQIISILKWMVRCAWKYPQPPKYPRLPLEYIPLLV